jgi:hypothetical protein
MKNLNLTLFSLMALFILTAFNYENLLKNENYTSTFKQSQVQTVYAWRMAGGQWQQGTVTYERNQFGYRPMSYDFSNYTNGGRNNFAPDVMFTPLNPNNDLAKKNNWTHTIRSMAGTLYLSLY